VGYRRLHGDWVAWPEDAKHKPFARWRAAPNIPTSRLPQAASHDSRSPRYSASVWPAVAVAPDGRAVVAWQDDRDDPDPLWTGTADGGAGTNPDDWQIMIAARNASGT
jgi:hypothetical protein